MEADKLNQEEQHAIREWLKRLAKERYDACPFGGWCGDNRKICERLFPKIVGKLGLESTTMLACPCSVYQHGYVVRKARLVLARKGRLKR